MLVCEVSLMSSKNYVVKVGGLARVSASMVEARC